MIHLGDITKLNGAEIPVVDVICGGSPCQDLSIAAGKRAGLDGERSGLFMEQIRVIKEMREHDRRSGRTGYMVRPRWVIWENVPGAFTSNGGGISKPSSRSSPGSQSQTLPLFLCLRRGGPTRDACTMTWQAGGALRGEYTTASFGAYPSEEYAYRLSQILEDSPPRKYVLSAKACAGILNRAGKFGTPLPPMLKEALENQAVIPSKSGGGVK